MIPAASIFLTAWLLLSNPPTQDTLSLEQALDEGLKNNYGLSLSRDQAAIAANALRSGQGRFLPSASADLTQTGKVTGNTPQTKVGASVNWLIFDGLQTYHAYRQAQMLNRSALLENRASLEALIESVVSAYYDIVQQKQKLKAIQDLLLVSQDRGNLASAKMEIGSGSRLELLQSLADLNLDSSSFLNQEVSLRNAKISLNQILGRDPKLDFEVSDSIPLDPVQPLEAWEKILLDNNTAVAAAKARRDAAAANVLEARGQWLPSLSTGLTYATAPEALNSPAASYSGDLTYRVMLTLPLFDQLTTTTGVGRAKLELHQAEIRVKLAESDALAAFAMARGQYESGLRLVALEERNLQIARLQAEGAQERFRVGSSTPLEFRDAQTRFLDAEVRMITARQKAKQSETALQKLVGLLVKQIPAQTPREAK